MESLAKQSETESRMESQATLVKMRIRMEEQAEKNDMEGMRQTMTEANNELLEAAERKIGEEEIAKALSEKTLNMDNLKAVISTRINGENPPAKLEGQDLSPEGAKTMISKIDEAVKRMKDAADGISKEKMQKDTAWIMALQESEKVRKAMVQAAERLQAEKEQKEEEDKIKKEKPEEIKKSGVTQNQAYDDWLEKVDVEAKENDRRYAKMQKDTKRFEAKRQRQKTGQYNNHFHEEGHVNTKTNEGRASLGVQGCHICRKSNQDMKSNEIKVLRNTLETAVQKIREIERRDERANPRAYAERESQWNPARRENAKHQHPRNAANAYENRANENPARRKPEVARRKPKSERPTLWENNERGVIDRAFYPEASGGGEENKENHTPGPIGRPWNTFKPVRNSYMRREIVPVGTEVPSMSEEEEEDLPDLE
jgi:hypothetical protein